MPSRVESLELFRFLVKYIRTLEHTDQRYLLNRVRAEFRRSNEVNDPAYTEFLFEVN
uniref:Complex1_LYR domain containing protein n=1 Tax=Echinococcus granulosus TaxID=6210 RepID=A0A068WRI2_ECHGR|nr:Complex1_LYR domain containing protein [Echinococcus granulosus]